MACEVPVIAAAMPEQPTSSTLCAALRVLDTLLAFALNRIEAELTPRGALDALRGLHISRGEVERSFRAEPRVASSGALVEAITDRLHDDVRFDRLIRSYRLDAFEGVALLIALAPEIDLRYQRIYAYLQDDVTKRRPTVDLILNLLCASDTERFVQRRAFSSDAALLRNDLVHLVADPNYVQPPLLAQYVKPDEQIARFLFDDCGIDSHLRASCRLVQPRATLAELAVDENTRCELVRSAREAVEDGGNPCLWLYGPDEAQQSTAAESFAHQAGSALLLLDASRVASSDLEEILRRALRDAALRPAVLYVAVGDSWLSESRATAQFAALVRERACPVVIGSTRPAPTAMLGTVRPLALPLPDLSQRAQCWRRSLAASVVESAEQTVATLAARFRLTGAQISSAVADAGQRSIGRPSDADLRAAARAQSGDALAAVADKIVPRVTWDDLVLPQDAIEQLRELCQRVDFQDRVFDDWGFGHRSSRGRGTSALFAGGSGTGKTMAAEVIANALGVDLYRIDLARVVSKYIGETEKNLGRVFQAAQSANAILFFDEADALFGKRSEVKDAHDRYANIEVSYLLQRMEEHDGLAILATNLADSLDEAFTRRLAFFVQFPFPAVEQRRRLWQRAWTAAAPTDGIDLDLLAQQFRLSGGNIRNVGLAASFLAAADGGVVRMPHVMHALRREHQKLGTALPAERRGMSPEEGHGRLG